MSNEQLTYQLATDRNYFVIKPEEFKLEYVVGIHYVLETSYNRKHASIIRGTYLQ